jgi:hypothetical protein
MTPAVGAADLWKTMIEEHFRPRAGDAEMLLDHETGGAAVPAIGSVQGSRPGS